MQYIEPVGAQGPANAFGHDYVDKNAGLGIAGSFLAADVPEHLMLEIVNMIAKSGMTPSGSNLQQLAASARSQKMNYVAPAQVTGSANAIVLTFSPAFPDAASLVAVPLRFIAESVPTGAVTLNVDGLGAASLVNAEGIQLGAGSLRVGQLIEAAFDGAVFQVLSPLREARPGQFYLIDQIIVPSDVAAVDWAIPASAANVDILRITGFMKAIHGGANMRISTDNGATFRAGATDYKSGYVSFNVTPAAYGNVYYDSAEMTFSDAFDSNSDGFATVSQTIFRGAAGLRGQAFGSCYGLKAGVGFVPTHFQGQVAAPGRITNLRWLAITGSLKATTRIIVEGLAP